jgi:hypothetical protein
MKKSRYTDEQIDFALRQAETGTCCGSDPQDGNSGADLLQLEVPLPRAGAR